MRTRYTELLGCRVPIQLAGMGWVAGPELATAVADAGGVGTIAPHLLPAQALESMLRPLSGRTIGFNTLIPFLDLEAVEIAAATLPFVEFFYGDPDPALVARVHRHRALVMWQVGSVAEAVAAEQAGCDVVIAQGVEAGGHVRGTTALLPLLDGVLSAVSVPVVATGGIATARGVAAVLAAGADAARIGTRFLATPEADIHPEYQAALLAATDTVRTTAFSTMWPDAPHRVLPPCIDAARRATGDTVGTIALGGRPVPIPRLGPQAPTRSTTGDIAAMPLYAGQGVAAVTRIEPAAQLVAELASGAARLLGRIEAAA